MKAKLSRTQTQKRKRRTTCSSSCNSISPGSSVISPSPSSSASPCTNTTGDGGTKNPLILLPPSPRSNDNTRSLGLATGSPLALNERRLGEYGDSGGEAGPPFAKADPPVYCGCSESGPPVCCGVSPPSAKDDAEPPVYCITNGPPVYCGTSPPPPVCCCVSASALPPVCCGVNPNPEPPVCCGSSGSPPAAVACQSALFRRSAFTCASAVLAMSSAVLKAVPRAETTLAASFAAALDPCELELLLELLGSGDRAREPSLPPVVCGTNLPTPGYIATGGLARVRGLTGLSGPSSSTRSSSGEACGSATARGSWMLKGSLGRARPRRAAEVKKAGFGGFAEDLEEEETAEEEGMRLP
ncbi:hypothetical protein B0H16DRAFT_429232 [Mycena metata]|uniref:Uncharacterized protein n=1 Tax=Mycena metata TaxID=1033252 RepID=A0AAD7JKL3_9AGAR|nr:hypothetical protein B0H16DRAFT_429232 [Mycena metata]